MWVCGLVSLLADSIVLVLHAAAVQTVPSRSVVSSRLTDLSLLPRVRCTPVAGYLIWGVGTWVLKSGVSCRYAVASYSNCWVLYSNHFYQCAYRPLWRAARVTRYVALRDFHATFLKSWKSRKVLLGVVVAQHWNGALAHCRRKTKETGMNAEPVCVCHRTVTEGYCST